MNQKQHPKNRKRLIWTMTIKKEHKVRKLFSILFIAITGCTSISKKEMLIQIQPKITELQERIDKDIQDEIKQNKDYQKCVAENAKLRAIADKVRNNFDKTGKIEFIATKEDCEILNDIEKQHNVKSFFEGFYYKDLGKCEMKLSIDPFKYRHMSWDYCDEHYKDNSRYWEICSNVFDEEITINGKRGIYLWEKNIVDDLSPASIINDGGRYSFRNIHTAENATSIDGQNVRYIIDLPHIPFFISETALSLAFISLDCHKQDGRFDKWKTEKNYKECFETFKDTLISPASFCKCAAEKTKAIEKNIAKIADEIDQKVAEEQAWKKIFTECLDSADKKGGVWQ